MRHLRSRHCRVGVSLIEVVFSTMLVAVILVGATEMLGYAVRGRTHSANTARAQQLAQQLMTEILNVNFNEPDTGGLLGGLLEAVLNTVGLDSGETATNRSAFDDVDDFHGWNESPPQTHSGSIVPNSTGWRRTVSVALVDPANPTIVVSTNQGVKRIMVTVAYNGQTLGQLTALRSDRYSP